MRELQLWDEGSMDQTFADVSDLAELCRFDDCTHEHEPGCAVIAACENGTLQAERLESYRKLQRELHHLRVKLDGRARAEQKRQNKIMTKSYRNR